MNDLATIPDEFMKAADRAAGSCFSGTSIRSRQGKLAIAQAIHDAVMAERERCAEVAECAAQSCLSVETDGHGYYACEGVARDIRTPIHPSPKPEPSGCDDLPF